MDFILVCISFNSFLTSLIIMDLNVNKSTDFLEPSMADGVLVTLPNFYIFYSNVSLITYCLNTIQYNTIRRIENISWVILVSIFLPLNRLHGMIICTLLYFHFSLLLQIFATTWTKGLRVRVATTRPLNFISSYSKSSNLKCPCCFIYVSLCFCGPLRMNHFSGAI